MSPNYFKFFILLCYSIIILSLTWFSPISLTGSNFISEYDKVLHILEYAILGYLFVNILHENQVLLGVIVKTGIFIVLFAWIGVDRFISNDARIKECEEKKSQGPSKNQKDWEWCDDCCGWREPGHNANKNN